MVCSVCDDCFFSSFQLLYVSGLARECVALFSFCALVNLCASSPAFAFGKPRKIGGLDCSCSCALLKSCSDNMHRINCLVVGDSAVGVCVFFNVSWFAALSERFNLGMWNRKHAS